MRLRDLSLLLLLSAAVSGVRDAVADPPSSPPKATDLGDLLPEGPSLGLQRTGKVERQPASGWRDATEYPVGSPRAVVRRAACNYGYGQNQRARIEIVCTNHGMSEVSAIALRSDSKVVLISGWAIAHFNSGWWDVRAASKSALLTIRLQQSASSESLIRAILAAIPVAEVERIAADVPVPLHNAWPQIPGWLERVTEKGDEAFYSIPAQDVITIVRRTWPGAPLDMGNFPGGFLEIRARLDTPRPEDIDGFLLWAQSDSASQPVGASPATIERLKRGGWVGYTRRYPERSTLGGQTVVGGGPCEIVLVRAPVRLTVTTSHPVFMSLARKLVESLDLDKVHSEYGWYETALKSSQDRQK